jgi:L-ascorbate metabolism protein UlaG (beta-lactamase superfamily)
MSFQDHLLRAPSLGDRDPAAARVRVQWLGTAGFALRAEGRTLLFDPYLTRAGLAACALERLVPDLDAIARHVPAADAIVVGHTHFDHALDVPAIAKRTGARVFGSSSAARLCRLDAVAEERIVDVEGALRCSGASSYEADVGPFHLRFFPSAHSKLVLGRVPMKGEIDDCDALPMRMHHYRCGAVFCVEVTVLGRRVVHLGSADLVEASLPPDVAAPDLLLACVAGWTKTARFPERVARAFDPRAVLLSHWDDFFTSIDRPVRSLPAMQIDRLVERLAREARDARVFTLDLLGEVAL